MSRRRPPAVRTLTETAVNARSAPVFALLFVFAALLTAAACAGVGSGSVTADDPAGAQPPPVASPASPAPRKGPVPLTAAQAAAVLVTDVDLGAPWTPTQGAATWRDGLLKATANDASPDCQRLLDALYTDEILGEPSSPGTAVALDDPADQAQLRYQVAVHRAADVDRTLGWLRTLPQTCGRFTATTTRAGVQDVQVTEEQLPQVGDAREGLRVTLTGQGTAGTATGTGNLDAATGTPVTGTGTANPGVGNTATGAVAGAGVLTLDIAAVRVGDDAITVTTGGPAAVPPAATQAALQTGVQRLTEARRPHPA
ncbi:hypothetical protein [Streptomyces sp. NPDC047000]|uniref:hypothetical protein n=1 Tax=Streptomyces sp. NPDC047000 TaxID=3155474 RepID=UPI0033EBD999